MVTSLGWTALHYAVDSQSNNSEILKLLLKQSNIRVDIPNSDNNLPIHYFSKRSYFDQGIYFFLHSFLMYRYFHANNKQSNQQEFRSKCTK